MENLGACGINCDTCNFKLDAACKGCSVIQGKPVWGECEWYSCARSKGLTHCCCCNVFPCEAMKEALIKGCGESGANEAINNLIKLHNNHKKQT